MPQKTDFQSASTIVLRFCAPPTFYMLASECPWLRTLPLIFVSSRMSLAVGLKKQQHSYRPPFEVVGHLPEHVFHPATRGEVVRHPLSL